jgi:HEAT repeat protein
MCVVCVTIVDMLLAQREVVMVRFQIFSRLVNRMQPGCQTGLTRLCASFIVGIATFAVPAAAAEAVPAALSKAVPAENGALDEALRKLAALQQGQGLEILHPIRLAVAQSKADETIRKDLEARLIELLQGGATDLAKDIACRQLALVGSDPSIPVLAELLPDARLSFMARYAMEGIGGPGASAALRQMLVRTDGRQQVGVVISLGRLADGDAVPALALLLDEEDEELRQAVVVALGRIGSGAAAAALKDFAAKAPAGLQDHVVDATLQVAASLCRQGEYETAVGLYEPLLLADSERVRAAALRGLICANRTESLAMIRAGLAVEESAADSWQRAVAADCVLELKQPDEIGAIAAALPELPAKGKIAAFNSLKDRCHPAVREAALVSLEQADIEVRVAALTALIGSALAEDVALLADLATTAEEPPVRDAAFAALRLMTASGTEQAIIALINQAERPNRVMVKCALARRSPRFIPAFLHAAKASDAAVRLEAFKALEIMATAEEAEELATLLCQTKAGAEREAAGRAVWMSCLKISDPARRSEPLLAAMGQADVAGECALLPVLARMGGEGSLQAVHVAMQSTDQAVRDAGFRALANWPDATVADELLDIAKTGAVESYRIWSLRAYARLVSLPSARPPRQTFEMLNGAMELATRGEDKQLIVSRLGSVRAPEALARLLSLLDDEQLAATAVPALFTLAKGLSQSHPDQAKAALERVQPLTKDAATLQQIPKVLRDIEARKEGAKP